MAVPKTMHAWTFSRRGVPSDLVLKDNYPSPQSAIGKAPSDNNILIHVSHVGLSSAGTNLMLTLPHLPSFSSLGRVAEIDFSGTIVSSGPRAPDSLQPGVKVFGNVPVGHHFRGVGTLAEYITVPATSVAVKPDNITPAEASALSSLGQTALHAIDRLKLPEGGDKKVLIHSGSGDVGILAVQIAKSRGATVVATASKGKMAMVKSFGADEVIDYQQHSPLHTYLASRPQSSDTKFEFDGILDLVGNDRGLFTHSTKYLKPNGIFIGIGNIGTESSPLSTITTVLKNNLPSFLGGTPRTFVIFGNAVSEQQLRDLTEMVAAGQINVKIDSVFDMAEAMQAYKRYASRERQGRIIVNVSKEASNL